MSKPAVSILIPTKNRLDLLEQCIGSLRQHVKANYEIIVIDTGDGSNAAWGQMNGCRVLAQPDGTFAQANNLAARKAQGNYLLLLNNDIVVQADFLKTMYEAATYRRDPAIVGARLFYANGLIQHGGIGFDMNGNPYHLWHNAPCEHPAARRLLRWLPAVTFACALVSKCAYLELGLDEEFRNGYEDIDFCLRAKERGWQSLYHAHASAIHLTHQTEGRFTNESENKQRFLDKWVGSGRLWDVLGCWPFTLGIQQ